MEAIKSQDLRSSARKRSMSFDRKKSLRPSLSGKVLC
jgi:hypothetical protein